MVQMFGALILAVGIPDVFRDNTQITVVVVGYAVMRLAMAAQWLRAGQDDVDRRQSCYRYAMGITLLQIVWIARLWMPAEWQVFILLPTMIAEMLVPVIAEYTGGTPWHPHHIAERYGLLIIIVLGEGILGATNAVANLLQAQGWSFDLLPLGLGITALVFAVWWLYFDMPWAAVLERERSLRTALLFGYSHYIVFAALAALGASLEVVADVVKHGHEGVIARSGVEETHVVSPLFAISTVAVALAIYLCSVAWMRAYVIERSHNIWMSLAAALLMLALAVGAVAFGLSLPWALLVTVTAPVVMTVICPNQATAEATP
jgi:low temperature requirement protein LtrA